VFAPKSWPFFFLWVINPLLWCLNVHPPLVCPLLAKYLVPTSQSIWWTDTHIATRIWKTIGRGGCGGVDFELSRVITLFFVIRIWVFLSWVCVSQKFSKHSASKLSTTQFNLASYNFQVHVHHHFFSSSFDKFLSLSKFYFIVLTNGCVLILTWCFTLKLNFLWMFSSRQFVGRFLIIDKDRFILCCLVQ
jgi:hypothetical protein